MTSDREQQREDSPKTDDGTLQPLMEFWSALIQHADGATRDMLEQISATAEPQVWRQRWLSAISQSLDAYMRSPAFLQAMARVNQKLTDTEALKTWHRFLKLPDIAEAARDTVATTPYRVVYKEGTLKLLLY